MSLVHLQGLKKVLAPPAQEDFSLWVSNSSFSLIGQENSQLPVNYIKRANCDFEIHLYKGQTEIQVFFSFDLYRCH